MAAWMEQRLSLGSAGVGGGFFFQRDFSSDKIIAAVIVKGVKQDGEG